MESEQRTEVVANCLLSSSSFRGHFLLVLLLISPAEITSVNCLRDSPMSIVRLPYHVFRTTVSPVNRKLTAM